MLFNELEAKVNEINSIIEPRKLFNTTIIIESTDYYIELGALYIHKCEIQGNIIIIKYQDNYTFNLRIHDSTKIIINTIGDE